MPYGNGCKIQFSLPEEGAVKLRKYRSGARSDSLAAKELLTRVLQRPSLLKSGELDGVAIREKMEALEQGLTSLENRSSETAQTIKALADKFEELARDWRDDALTRAEDYGQQQAVIKTLKEFLQALSGNVRRTTTANDD